MLPASIRREEDRFRVTLRIHQLATSVHARLQRTESLSWDDVLRTRGADGDAPVALILAFASSAPIHLHILSPRPLARSRQNSHDARPRRVHKRNCAADGGRRAVHREERPMHALRELVARA
jgi:hypothetical protein